MTFDQLYGTELDRELGTADRTVRFTTERRKAAINAAQLEWVERTQCTTRQVPITLVHGQQEYDLDALSSDVINLSAQGVSIKIVGTTGTRYLDGDDLEITSVNGLNAQNPNWRAESSGTPRAIYLRRDGGRAYLGFQPAVSVSGSDVWTALVGVVVIPADLVSDADEPFTINGNPLRMLRPYHRALVHFAACDLEKLRKDAVREAAQLELWENYIIRYEAAQKPKNGQRVRMVKDYRREAHKGSAPRHWDPRVWP
jgi:hypothetical protein